MTDTDDDPGERQAAMSSTPDPEFVEAIAAWALKDAARRSPVEAVERALADYGSPKIGTDEYVSVRYAAVVKSTTARLDVSWPAEQPATGQDEADRLRKRFAELADGMTVAVELLDRLANDDECELWPRGCQTHGGYPDPCPHPLARQVVAAWRAVQAEGADDV